jgi:hypothetical protein
VCLTKPDDPTEDTLALLSQERINDIDAQWKIHFADSQVLVAIGKLFSPTPDSLSHLVSFVKKHVKLPPKEIRESLGRLRASFEFPVPSTKPFGKTGTISNGGVGDVEYRDFWAPIRTDPNGLFAGKPAGGTWITKSLRNIALSLVVQNHACCVELTFYTEDRAKRRDAAVKLLSALKCDQKIHDTPKMALVRFAVLDKGIKDRDCWPEIREKLTKLGTDIYNRIKDSDV